MTNNDEAAPPYFANIWVTKDGGLRHINELLEPVYAKCDGCNCDMTEENGCHSYWFRDKMITVCDKCSLDIMGDNNPR